MYYLLQVIFMITYSVQNSSRPSANFRAINTNDLAKEHMVSPSDRSIIWGVAQFIQACAEE